MVSDTIHDWTKKSRPNLSVDRSTSILDQVDYKLAESAAEKEEIYRLRYRAYLREGAIFPSTSETVRDRYDDMSNSWIFGVYVGAELHSSIRISVLNEKSHISPAADHFSDSLRAEIERGKTIVDTSHFVADPDRSKKFPELPYITLRLAFVACGHFNADLGLVTVRPEHQAFYRRVFRYIPASEPRSIPGLVKPQGLMVMDYASVHEAVFERFPYLRSSNFERRMLFQRDSSKFGSAKQSLAEIKDDLRRMWAGDPVLPLCLKILDHVTIGPINDQETLDFSALCQLTGKNRPDSELLRAVTILTTSNFSALRVCAKLLDEDGTQHELSPEVLSAVVSSKSPTLLHPITGRVVDSFEESLIIYFAPTTIFEKPLELTRADL